MSNTTYEEALEEDKTHFIKCEDCGEMVDCRSLDEVFQHMDHKSHPDIPYSGSRRIK